jgi:4a-hydroxytetrahydrobiopterin dehydratase
MEVLDNGAIQSALRELPGWARDGKEIVRTFEFETFRSAMTFVDRVAQAAEAANHHPDIDIRYAKVTLRLMTHDAGGLTRADLSMARRADNLAGGHSHPPGQAGAS